jgi:uncharacterized Fe-S cluster-containing MiaB family protein
VAVDIEGFIVLSVTVVVVASGCRMADDESCLACGGVIHEVEVDIDPPWVAAAAFRPWCWF